jgi:excisionase family DNA binding protein
MDRLLTIDEAAEALGTGERFVRRLIAERRIRFHKIGRHVRISSTDLDAFVAAGVVEPVPLAVGRRRAAPTLLRRGA